MFPHQITTALLLLLAVCVPSAFGDNEVAAPNKTGAVKMTSKNIDMTLGESLWEREFYTRSRTNT